MSVLSIMKSLVAPDAIVRLGEQIHERHVLRETTERELTTLRDQRSAAEAARGPLLVSVKLGDETAAATLAENTDALVRLDRSIADAELVLKATSAQIDKFADDLKVTQRAKAEADYRQLCDEARAAAAALDAEAMTFTKLLRDWIEADVRRARAFKGLRPDANEASLRGRASQGLSRVVFEAVPDYVKAFSTGIALDIEAAHRHLTFSAVTPAARPTQADEGAA